MDKLISSLDSLQLVRKCNCGADISQLPKNYKRCDNCRVKKTCTTCNKTIRNSNRSGYCKDCHMTMKIAAGKHCSNCNKLLSIRNKSGYCKKCTFAPGKKAKQESTSINNNITRYCDKCNKPFDSIATDMHLYTCNNCRTFSKQQEKNTERKLAKQGYSKVAIAWLNSIMAEKGIHIQHALNGGEYTAQIGEYTFSFDGYCKETNTVYEFYGDKYHGNLQVYKADEILVNGKTARQLYAKTLWREKQILSAGYNLVTIWESQYNKR